MPKFDYDYYSGAESEQFRFLKIPKVFFEDPDYLDLGLAECILYGFLHEQVAFSKQNGWVDEAGKTYVIRSLESIQKLLHDCSADKARSTLKNLIEFGLIEKKRRGQGKPDIIYVKNFVSKKSEKSYSEETDDCGKLFSETGKTEVLNDEKPISREGDFLVLEVGNSAPIDPNNYLKNIIEPNHNLIQVTGNTTGAAESVDNSGWDEDVMSIGYAMGRKLDEEQIKKLLAGEKIFMKGLKSKKGKSYDAFLKPEGVEAYDYTNKDGEEKSGFQFKFAFEFPERKKKGE